MYFHNFNSNRLQSSWHDSQLLQPELCCRRFTIFTSLLLASVHVLDYCVIPCDLDQSISHTGVHTHTGSLITVGSDVIQRASSEANTERRNWINLDHPLPTGVLRYFKFYIGRSMPQVDFLIVHFWNKFCISILLFHYCRRGLNYKSGKSLMPAKINTNSYSSRRSTPCQRSWAVVNIGYF